MPVYDVHTHIGLDTGFYLRGWWPYAATCQDLQQHMDANGVDRAVCFPFGLPSAFDAIAYADGGKVVLRPDRTPFDRENALLVQEVQRIAPDGRLLPFAMFDPSRRVEEQIKFLQPLVGKIRGLKLQATILESFVPDLLDKGKDLMALATQHGLPVLIHTSIVETDRFSQVADCLKVALANPKVRFVLAHSHRFHEATLREAAQIDNVWVDCSAHLAHIAGVQNNAKYVAKPEERVDADYTDPVDPLIAIHDILGDRYVWGSDSPFNSWVDSSISHICSYRDEANILHALPENVKNDMAVVGPEAWLFGK